MGGREREMQDRERGLQEREQLLVDSLQAPRRRGSDSSITEFLENMADTYRIQCDQLNEQLDVISIESAMLRAFYAWRQNASAASVGRKASDNEATVVQLKSVACVTDAELTKLQGTVSGLLPELFMLEERIKALAPEIGMRHLGCQQNRAPTRGWRSDAKSLLCNNTAKRGAQC